MWRYLFLIPVYLLVGSLPLLTKAGANLEYEYVLLTSYLTLISLPLFALFLKERHLPITNGGFNPPIATEILWLGFVGPFIALLPAIYMFGFGLCRCSSAGFGFWWLVQWLPAWIIGHALLHLVIRLRVRGVGKRWIGIGLAAGTCLIAVYVASELWFHPQKRLMSLLAGFLHGPIYDDWIPFDSGLLLQRSAHLLLAMLALAAVWYKNQIRLAVAMGVLAIAYATTSYLASSYPSTWQGRARLDQLMTEKLAGDGFTLRYTTNKPGSTNPSSVERMTREAERLFRDASYHVRDLTKILGGSPLPHVIIYAYPSDDTKKLWFGGGSTDVADVYTPSIHITLDDWPHPTLRHELVHALASGFGFHGLGFHPNMAFTEGLAEALAPREQLISLNDGAASLIDSGRLPHIENLFSPAFWRESGSRAYTVAGSFINHLIANKGIEEVKRLYAGASWQEAFGADRDSLITQWRESIMSSYDRDRYKMYTEALYKYPGVLADICPHSKADLRRSRHGDPFARLRQPIGWNPDTDYGPWLLSLDSNNKELRFRMWKQEISRVATDRYAAPGRLIAWRETLKNARLEPAQTLTDVEMALVESDLARVTGDAKGSVDILLAQKKLSTKLFLGSGLTRQIDARLRLEQILSDEAATEWRAYLAGWRKSPPSEDSDAAPWIVSYLNLRNDTRHRTKPWELSHKAGLTPDPAMSSDFHIEWYKLLGLKFMHAELYPEAGKAYRDAAALAGGDRAIVFSMYAKMADFYDSLGKLSPTVEAMAPAVPVPAETKPKPQRKFRPSRAQGR